LLVPCFPSRHLAYLGLETPRVSFRNRICFCSDCSCFCERNRCLLKGFIPKRISDFRQTPNTTSPHLVAVLGIILLHPAQRPEAAIQRSTTGRPHVALVIR
ncbi:unnamed protein product, partial [Pylaiella littoralis]